MFPVFSLGQLIKAMFKWSLSLTLLVFALSVVTTISYAGTIALPSAFALHRPLNPALITRINETGGAYGVGLGNRDLMNKAPNNCELKDYSRCRPDKSIYRMGYTSAFETFYLRIESLSVDITEKDVRTSSTLSFNESVIDILGSIAFKTEYLTIGAYRRDTDLRLREKFVDKSASFTSKLGEYSINYGYGARLRFADWFQLGYYRDGPTQSKVKHQNGRVFEEFTEEGLRGGGIGFRWDFGGTVERPDELNLEVFRLLTKSPVIGADAQLTGLNFELTLWSIVFYIMVLNDDNNNYFNGELLRDASVSIASGVGYNGDWFQILFGRDVRYLAGIDGGFIGILGVQF